MGFFRDLVQRFLGGPRPEVAPSVPAAPRPTATPVANPASPTIDRPTTSLGLDAGDFVPVSGEERDSKIQARGVASFRSAWLGRRDVIPPSDDEATRQIDRGMVAEGFLSPEELAEIHRVGQAMERARPTSESIERRSAGEGQAAVEADRAERARIKASKQAQAAEKRRLHAEGVAHRQATDIIYLGRGVSKFLGDRRSDLAALEASGLPLLSTPGELAEALGLSVSRLRWLAFHAEAATRIHYVTFEVAKKSGGTRKLSAPPALTRFKPALDSRPDRRDSAERARGPRVCRRAEHPDQRRSPRRARRGGEP